tara:strand:- start:95 stop:754 length:660 start_codon:yes stop_codon:yes gene_type:complete
MAHTLAAARDSVRRLLDDDGSNQRYATSAIDQALQDALSRGLSDYASAGGDVFDTEASVATVAGVATLTGPIILVRSVQISVGNSRHTVRPMRRVDRRLVDVSVRTLLVELVRDYVLPTNTAHPFVGDGATPANSWHGFDMWCFSMAALQLGITDNDQRPGLNDLEQRLRSDVMRRANAPISRPMPDSESHSWMPSIGYVYNANIASPTIQLVQRDAWL